ncbi:Crp/Fnr family transcriptional regulator [Chitinophaga qingshengii]|uniref:Crp/Fnr family transcriptional regulator n=1 Tax=Chitinophaga qingshengii TaxID=1569794 RepID=A0ABR7TWA9_9BACT|nr:Crp/Fnr family transcriptional regulator [Chitinophaga qingshengii]MBC9934712.1 Crp/Fnr family transcriptional regulator [Chitinophaga qingshengii]
MSLAGLFPIDKWNFQSRSVLSNLPDEEYTALTSLMTIQRYNKGEVIFREGAPAFGIYYILKGKVKKYRADKDGGEQIIYVANTGELVGYHAILANGRYPDSAATLEESSIAFIPKDDFLLLLNRSAVLARRLLKTLSHEFTVLTNGISAFTQRSVQERLAITLIVLREKYKDEAPSGQNIQIRIPRADLANMVGTGIENVTRFLSAFKQAGVLTISGKNICITDVKKLVEISGCGEPLHP